MKLLNFKIINFCVFFCLLFQHGLSHSYQTYFSPEADLDKIIIDEISIAKKSIDLSIYTFRSLGVSNALANKLKENPNFNLRVLIRKVDQESMETYLNPILLELKKNNLNFNNIRFVNITNHHKFMIIDEKKLLNTSGNINDTDLAKSYDENMFVCSRTCNDLVQGFKSEFDYLFSNSNPVYPNEDHVLTLNPKAPDTFLNTYFTSHNFYPETHKNLVRFRVHKDRNKGAVETALLAAIQNAKSSIKVATGHLRSWTLAQALAEAAKNGVDVDVILDSQEYISKEFQQIEDQEKEDCLTAKNSNSKVLSKSKEECLEFGFHFGRWLSEHKVHVYFKYYMIFWDFINAPQMHHKYMIVDNDVVYTGSYNWSKNAEFKTFENLSVITNKKAVNSYIKNFDLLIGYGRSLKSKLIKNWQNETQKISLVFEPMALNVLEIDQLRDLLRQKCPDVFSLNEQLESKPLSLDEESELSSNAKDICVVK